MSLEQALTLVRAAGYRVSLPKPKATPVGLNAIGKPFSPQYDPRYRVKHKTTTAHLFKPYGELLRSRLTPHQGV